MYLGSSIMFQSRMVTRLQWITLPPCLLILNLSRCSLFYWCSRRTSSPVRNGAVYTIFSSVATFIFITFFEAIFVYHQKKKEWRKKKSGFFVKVWEDKITECWEYFGLSSIQFRFWVIKMLSAKECRRRWRVFEEIKISRKKTRSINTQSGSCR